MTCYSGSCQSHYCKQNFPTVINNWWETESMPALYSSSESQPLVLRSEPGISGMVVKWSAFPLHSTWLWGKISFLPIHAFIHVSEYRLMDSPFNQWLLIYTVFCFVALIVLGLANGSPSKLTLGCVDMFLSFSKHFLTFWQKKLLQAHISLHFP